MARKIGLSHRVLVATPDLAARVSGPRDLEQIESVSYRTGMTEWRMSFQWNGRRREVRIPCRLGVNSMTAVRMMVLDGRGAHLGREWAFADDIAAGQLVRLLPEAEFDAFPIHAVWSPTPFQPAAPRTFVDEIAKSLRSAGLV